MPKWEKCAKPGTAKERELRGETGLERSRMVRLNQQQKRSENATLLGSTYHESRRRARKEVGLLEAQRRCAPGFSIDFPPPSNLCTCCHRGSANWETSGAEIGHPRMVATAAGMPAGGTMPSAIAEVIDGARKMDLNATSSREIAETLSMLLPPRRVFDQAIRPPRVITIHVVASWRYFSCHPRSAEQYCRYPRASAVQNLVAGGLSTDTVVQEQVSTFKRDTRLRVTSGCEQNDQLVFMSVVGGVET
ncbi:hypothetical protein K449DRAFT_468183 [Hypoxylon sp. EC38]|nr:hypothetical protein K449DRAFT_468183 [Hypoxylon sp. EC38]